jgi:hypothetical protein
VAAAITMVVIIMTATAVDITVEMDITMGTELFALHQVTTLTSDRLDLDPL